MAILYLFFICNSVSDTWNCRRVQQTRERRHSTSALSAGTNSRIKIVAICLPKCITWMCTLMLCAKLLFDGTSVLKIRLLLVYFFYQCERTVVSATPSISKYKHLLTFQTSRLTIRLIQKFCEYIIYFVMIWFIIRYTSSMTYLFLYFYKFFE